MKTLIAVMLGCALIGSAVAARDSSIRLNPEMTAVLDSQKKVIAQWAANPTVVAAVRAQNAKGPLPGMTNAKWKSLAADDPLVLSFQKNAAGVLLTKKMAASHGLIREAFLNAAQGEKVAFVQKPTNYNHAKEPKFDGPMSGQPWQGKPEWDKSSHSHAVQISTPVFDRGKPIGVLVAGVSVKELKSP